MTLCPLLSHAATGAAARSAATTGIATLCGLGRRGAGIGRNATSRRHPEAGPPARRGEALLGLPADQEVAPAASGPAYRTAAGVRRGDRRPCPVLVPTDQTVRGPASRTPVDDCCSNCAKFSRKSAASL